MPVGICVDILKAKYPVAQKRSQQFVESANIVVLKVDAEGPNFRLGVIIQMSLMRVSTMREEFPRKQ
jgi:hypothetical protein